MKVDVAPIRRPVPPAPCYAWLLLGGGRRALEVLLDRHDGDARWGSSHDHRGNRVEVHVYDGDPYAAGADAPRRGSLPPLPR